MGKFTTFINSHFAGSGCRLIARAYDKCRKRRVELFAIPGYWNEVGVTDGTDAWIAPCVAGPFFGTATGDCVELLRRLQAGDDLPPPPDWPEVEPKDAPKRARVALEDDDPPPRPSRQRIALDEQDITPRRTRRAVLA